MHYTAESAYGPYWSVSRYNDIMAVDTNHQVFSSEDGIALQSLEAKAEAAKRPTRQSFISMDPPKHDEQRKTVAPIVSHESLVGFSSLIR